MKRRFDHTQDINERIKTHNKSLSSTTTTLIKQNKLNVSNDIKDDSNNGINLLCWACQCQSLEALKRILQRGVGMDMINQGQGPYRLTPLHIAASVGFSAGIDALIKHPDLDLNQTDIRGWTALHYTAYDHLETSTCLLLEAGARVDLYDTSGRLALHYAIRNKSLKIIRSLLVKRERNNPTSINLIWSSSGQHDGSSTTFPLEEAIIMASHDGSQRIVQALVNAGAFTQERNGWWEDKYESKRSSLLSLCVYWNRFDCLKYLIKTMKSKDDDIQRAFELAVQQRKIEMVIYLGNEVKWNPSSDLNGMNPSFLYAANHGFMEMIPFLLTPTTSLDCIQQAILFSSIIEKDESLKDILQHYHHWKKPIHHDASIANEAIINILFNK
ncbi:ankyrin repeat-containing domain protein [Cokeromyces recurvatus]|uniref:ankyrin repeat-containing domain protein n=1 Tax=Cokeromyces recurvatus TaxID=90255 RepID=UPI00221E8184|nr:ankyrin repeat-containing domain protein [Cokeromyces recurvatus]KAI7905424.1 ankyrin repeat-containing domain protein [Cokeromyces recurvatus]